MLPPKDFICKALLEDHDSDDTINQKLLVAASEMNVTAVRNLIERGVNINFANERGITPLHKAVFISDKAMVESLLEYKPNVDLQTKDGRNTPLMLAAEKGNANILKLLLDNGANKKLKNRKGNTALDVAKDNKCRALLENHDTINQKLLVAASEKNVSAVRNLIERGADINYANESGTTALHKAVFISDETMVKALLEYKPKIDAQSEITHRTPLMLAAIQGNAIILKFLLDNGADKKLRNYQGKTALDMTEDFNCKATLEDEDAYTNLINSVNQKQQKIANRNLDRILNFTLTVSITVSITLFFFSQLFKWTQK
jgi:ankyrin repeat protein